MSSTKSIAHLLRPSLSHIQSYRVENAEGMIKLDMMENPFSLPESAGQAILEHIKGLSFNRYPDPHCTILKQALIQQKLVPAHLPIVLGNGSDEIIQMLHIILRQGSTVMALDPSFSMYQLNAEALGLRFVKVPLNHDFTLPLDRVLSAIHHEKPALLWIAYPNNPTGNLFDREAIIELIQTNHGITVIDEAYLPFTAGASLMDMTEKYPRLLVMRTLSKLGLAGLRVGYLTGDPSILSYLEKIRLPFNIDRLSAGIASFVITRYHSELVKQAEIIIEERERLKAFFEKENLAYNFKVFPSQANFLLIRCLDAKLIFQRLREKKILIKNVSDASDLLKNCLRFTIGAPSENQIVRQAITQFNQPII